MSIVKETDPARLASSIVYGTIKSNVSGGGKNCAVSYRMPNGNIRFLFKTEQLPTKFGISKWTDNAGGPDKYSMQVMLEAGEETYELMKAIDSANLEFVVANQKALLEKTKGTLNKSSELIAEKGSFLVKENQYGFYFTAKVEFNKQGDCTTLLVNKDRDVITHDAVHGGSVICLLEFRGVWSNATGAWGMCAYLKQCVYTEEEAAVQQLLI